MRMDLERIPLDKIEIITGFNVRENFGKIETKDLEESIKSTKGNIQPIIVSKEDDKYKIIAGERRFKALISTGQTDALCLVYEGLSETEKIKLMVHENIGTKKFSLKNLGVIIDQEFLSKQKVARGKIWDLLESLEAVEIYPDLMTEKTRKSCLIKYRRLKQKDINYNNNRYIYVASKVIGSSPIESIVINQLKFEVEDLKRKLREITQGERDNLFTLIRRKSAVERLKNGVWLEHEVRLLAISARQCDMFGLLNIKDAKCQKCQHNSPKIFIKCEFFRDKLGELKDLTKGELEL